MLKVRVVIIFLLSLNFGLIYGEARSQPTQKQPITQSKSKELAQSQTTTQEKPSEQFVTPQQMINAITSAIDASNKKYKANKNTLPPKDMYIFQFLLTIFTGGLVIVGGIQCYIIFRTLKQTQVVAKAAIDSAQIAETAMIHSQRAYVFVQQFLHEIERSNVTIDIVLENTGETPVKNMIYNFDYCIYPDAMPKDFDYPEKGPRQYGIIGRNATLTIPILIPSDVINPSLNNTTRVFIYGWIDYNDVFLNTPRHRTEFCYEMKISADMSSNLPRFIFTIYGKYNNFDDDCSQKPSPYTPPT